MKGTHYDTISEKNFLLEYPPKQLVYWDQWATPLCTLSTGSGSGSGSVSEVPDKPVDPYGLHPGVHVSKIC